MAKNSFEDFAEEIRKQMREFDDIKVRCAVIGNSGSGKSSLINAIVGKRVAKSRPIESLEDPMEYHHGGLILVDLPGCGTPRRPKDTYVRDMNLQSFDFFLFVTSPRFLENDLFIYREILRIRKECFVVRSMFDRAIDDAKHDDQERTEDELRALIEHNIRENLHPDQPSRIYLTSARKPQSYDLPQLLDDMADVLGGMKKDRFVADMAALSKDALRRKKKIAEQVVGLHAALAAANGLNPIPGLDISVDIGILLDMGRKIGHIYGIEIEQIDFVKKLLSPEAWAVIAGKVAQFGAKYFAIEGIGIALKRMATRTALKQTSKWLPFAGLLVAAGIGWKTTFMFGEQLIEDAEEIAEELLQKLIDGGLLES